MEVRAGKMHFVRLSIGLNPVYQKNNRRAPARQGYWAMPWPYFEPFLAYHQYDDAYPKRLDVDVLWSQVYDLEDAGYAEEAQELITLIDERREERKKYFKTHIKKLVRLHHFWHPGPLWSVIDRRGEVTHPISFYNDKATSDGWNYMTIQEFEEAAKKHLAGGRFWRAPDGKVHQTRSWSKDYLEVFIPDKGKL